MNLRDNLLQLFQPSAAGHGLIGTALTCDENALLSELKRSMDT